MTVATIKRGATFKAQLIFDADEWAEIYPWTSIEAEVGQGPRRFPLRYPLATSVNAGDRTITLSADSSAWLIGDASFDAWVLRGTEVLPIPASSNIPLKIIEGVGR